jgi:hypothetical protein
MDTLMRVATELHYKVYSNDSGRISPICERFSHAPHGNSTIMAVRAKTTVPMMTVNSWREQVCRDPEWRPSADYFALAHHPLPDDLKELIARFIRCQFLAFRGR